MDEVYFICNPKKSVAFPHCWFAKRRCCGHSPLSGLFKPRAGSQVQRGLLRGTRAFHAAAYRIGSLRIGSLPPSLLWNREKTQYAARNNAKHVAHTRRCQKMLMSASQAALCLLHWLCRENYPSNLPWALQSPLFLGPGVTYSKVPLQMRQGDQLCLSFW